MLRTPYTKLNKWNYLGLEKEKKRHNVPEGLFTLAEKVTGSVMKNRILHVNRTDIGQYRSHLYNFEKLYDEIKSKERENAKTVGCFVMARKEPKTQDNVKASFLIITLLKSIWRSIEIYKILPSLSKIHSSPSRMLRLTQIWLASNRNTWLFFLDTSF